MHILYTCRKLLLLLILAVLVGMPGYSYVIGISPASKDICIAPGYNVSTYIAPSTNSNETVLLNITVDSELLKLNKEIYISRESDIKIPIVLQIPEGQEQGLYETKIHVCNEEQVKSDGFPVRTCVVSMLNLDISSKCVANFVDYVPDQPENGAPPLRRVRTSDKGEKGVSFLYIVLGIIIGVFGVGYYLYRVLL